MKYFITAGIFASILGSAACTTIPVDQPPVAIEIPEAPVIGDGQETKNWPVILEPGSLDPGAPLIGNGAQGPAVPPSGGPLIGPGAYNVHVLNLDSDAYQGHVSFGLIEHAVTNVECTRFEEPVTWQDLMLPPIVHVNSEPRCGEK